MSSGVLSAISVHFNVLFELVSGLLGFISGMLLLVFVIEISIHHYFKIKPKHML